MKKVLLVATVQSHISQFHIPLINMLKKEGYMVEVAAKNNLDVKPGLSVDAADKVYDIPFSRSPFNKSNIKAYKLLKKLISENDYDIIHCNTPVGGFLTRLAAKKTRKNGTKVIYTAHGFHFFKGASIINWLLYYPIEWYMSFKTDLLITMNKEDYNRAKKHFHAKRIEYVRGVGFDDKRCVRSESKEEARKKLNIPKDASVLFSIGELNRRKNHEVIIDALEKLKNKNIYWYIAGNGPLEDYLKEKTKEKKLENNIIFLGYTRNVIKYFEVANMFVFPSLQEGLPLALMEAMCFGLPVVASNIRGTNDLIEATTGGFLVDKYDSQGFADKIKLLTEDENLCAEMAEHNKKIVSRFKVDAVLKDMKNLYEALQ